MGQVVQAAGSGAVGSVLLGVVVSLLIGYGTLSDQSVVVTLNGVFNDGGKGGGLIGALAKFLNGRDQFHRFGAEANAELLGGIRMLVCHDYGCGWE